MKEMLLFTLPKEEWITIANIKLTEDIAMFERTKDINGNPFNCKKVIVSVSLANSHGVSGQDWYFGIDGECKVTWRSTNGHVLSMECCGGIQQYMQYPYAFNLNTSNMFSAFRYDNVETIDKVVLTPPADNPLLSGDTIRIVGVKA